MNAGVLRQAAEVMRREEHPFFDDLANLLDALAAREWPRGDLVAEAAERAAATYLHDPGPLPTEPA